jgi:hypothetical protein
MKHPHLLASVMLAALTCPGLAQTGHVGYSPGGNVVCRNQVLPNLACSPTTAQINPYNPLGGGFVSTAGTVLGGHALDQDHNLCYVSDGFTIFVCANPLFAPAPCGGGPLVGSNFPVPSAVVLGSGLPFGLLTGMCVGHDVWTTSPSLPCTDILFITNGEWVMGIDVRPPYAVVIPPWFANGVFPQVLTGLEYEDTGGPIDFIWACDGVGNSFIYTITGALAGGPFPVIGPPPAPPVTGNVFDRSTCPPGYWVTNGTALYPSVFANPTIPLNPIAAFGLAFGASASAEPVLMAGRCGSTCTPFPSITTDEPICGGKNITFILSGAPPGQVAILAADPTCVPGGFSIFGCTWWLTFGPWLITNNTNTNAFGIATAGPYPLPAATCPGNVGLTGYAQWVFLDPCPGGNGFGMTDALHLRLSTF